ncbi:MAG: hypothetical protein PHN74_01450 [Candidatus Pacebacteria bacterium]|nr:hypothetical protein [Candidatus Paceibacterota bacterium]
MRAWFILIVSLLALVFLAGIASGFDEEISSSGSVRSPLERVGEFYVAVGADNLSYRYNVCYLDKSIKDYPLLDSDDGEYSFGNPAVAFGIKKLFPWLDAEMRFAQCKRNMMRKVEYLGKISSPELGEIIISFGNVVYTIRETNTTAMFNLRPAFSIGPFRLSLVYGWGVSDIVSDMKDEWELIPSWNGEMHEKISGFFEGGGIGLEVYDFFLRLECWEISGDKIIEGYGQSLRYYSANVGLKL